MPGLEIERELPLPFGEQRAQHDTNRCAALELGGRPLHGQQIAERERTLAARPANAHQTPLLQIPQVIVGDRWIETADVARSIRPARSRRRRRH
jgi:hypothetical protein